MKQLVLSLVLFWAYYFIFALSKFILPEIVNYFLNENLMRVWTHVLYCHWHILHPFPDWHFSVAEHLEQIKQRWSGLIVISLDRIALKCLERNFAA